MNEKDIMKLGIKESFKTMKENIGGPFGAVVVKDNEIISISSNSVLRDNDPTAHAEINAIRAACHKLKTYDLSGCTLYATAYPCPMCISAIIWSNIKTVYFGCTSEDTDKIGFRDDFIYNYIRNNNKDSHILDIKQLNREDCIKLFEEYRQNNKTIY